MSGKDVRFVLTGIVIIAELSGAMFGVSILRPDVLAPATGIFACLASLVLLLTVFLATKERP